MKIKLIIKWLSKLTIKFVIYMIILLILYNLLFLFTTLDIHYRNKLNTHLI